MDDTRDGRRREAQGGAQAWQAGARQTRADAPRAGLDTSGADAHGDGPEGDAPLPDGRASFRFGRRQRLYRGAPPDPNIPYIACLGGERSFGRGADAPWPERLGQRLDFQTVNFGVEGAGPGFFLADSGLLDACDGAAHCVMELCGAWNLSNRYYSVGRRYNRRLRGFSDHLRELYHDVRLEEFTVVGKLMDALHAHDPDRFALIEEEARAAWVARTRALLEAIEAPVTLLWFGHRRPSEDLRPDPARPRTLPPEAVTQAMVEAVLPFSAGYAEIVFERPADGGRPKAAPTDAMHERIAEAAQRATAPLLT